ncbi:class I SAM-dependent methyltransferase [Rhizorhabdus phycosphaerae]|uniref:class I SAM-dependent methyltransferase n=1 Tax=Rhizorhabdus phycosphaerae TaxID=2711156 RepID=UPI0013E9CF0C|nr:class I SAM-dependent methyltransferase [Rhizorhabdus phycosphaerae]
MATYEGYDSTLIEEAAAFNGQINERLKGGHVPDIRNAPDCDYFYNNPWRRKYFVDLDFGEQFEIISKSISCHTVSHCKPPRILEIGCGPGYMSLELARYGCDVTGLDISDDCISAARKTAQKFSPDIFTENLQYICDDLFSFSRKSDSMFDVVLFVGALHHFADQPAVHEAVGRLMKNDGILICHEPLRDRVTKRNAIANLLVTRLLEASGNYYTALPSDFSSKINYDADRKFMQLRYELEDGEKAQSVNDNEAGFGEIFPHLNERYEQLEFNWRYGLFHEIIGGLRFSDRRLEASVARFIRDIDLMMCDNNMIDPTEFYYVGRKI